MRAITVKFWIEKKNYIRLNEKEFLKGGGDSWVQCRYIIDIN